MPDVTRLLATVVLLAALSVAGSSTPPGTAAINASASHPSYCPTKTHVLDGVYHPQRLKLIKVCQRAVGVITKIRPIEQDGDLHILFKLAPTYTGLTNDVNDAKQGGNLVVEFMPRDGGHLLRPKRGDRVTLVGAWATDLEHGCATCVAQGWNELHPVWREILNGAVYTSGPQNGGSPAADRSVNSEDDCRDHGHACTGYRGGG